MRAVLLSGQLSSGPRVEELEARFAEYIGVRYAVAVNSGTAALHVALACCSITPGDEVIVPALSFFSTVSAVLHQRATPIFADVSSESFCLDPEDFAARITPRTRAVIPVHYFGHAAEMDEICRIAARHGIAVIEDCAQAHGTRYRGRRVGSIAAIGAFSFFATKHMTTGEGGAITTDDANWAATARRMRNHGLEGRRDHVLLGYNYRMPEIAAALGLVQLAKLEELNRRRHERSRYLMEKLHPLSWAIGPRVPEHVEHTFFWCHYLIEEEELGFSTQELIERLARRGVEVRHRYRRPLYRQPLLNRFRHTLFRPDLPPYGDLHLPVAERVAGRIIGLPNRPDMSRAELDRVVDVLLHIRD